MKRNITLGRSVLRMLLIAFVVGSLSCVYADGFASETNGFPPNFPPELLHERDVRNLSGSIVFSIEVIETSEAKLKSKGISSSTISLIFQEEHCSIKEKMGKLLTALNGCSLEAKQKHAEMLHVLEAAIQADSVFDEAGEGEVSAKRDVAYWKKRIASIESILRPCNEFGFTPVSVDEKPQQENQEPLSATEVADRTDRNLGILWVVVPSIVVVAGIAVVLRLRRRRS